MDRDFSLDRIKGIAVIFMVACHGCLYLYDYRITNLRPYESTVLWLSYFSAPAFLYCYSFVTGIERPWSRILHRAMIIFFGALAFDALILFLTARPFVYHILYDFLIVTFLLPFLIKLKPVYLLSLTLIIPLIGIAHEYYCAVHGVLPFNLVHSIFFSYRFDPNFIPYRDIQFPIIPFLSFITLGVYVRQTSQEQHNALFLPLISLCVLSALVEAGIAGMTPDGATSYDPSYRMYLMMIILLLVHRLATLQWPVIFDTFLLPMGRHVLPIYVLHHAPLFLFAIATGWHIQYGRMMMQSMPFVGTPQIWTASIAVLLIFSYGVARVMDRISVIRRVRRYEAASGVDFSG